MVVGFVGRRWESAGQVAVPAVVDIGWWVWERPLVVVVVGKRVQALWADAGTAEGPKVWPLRIEGL